MLLVRQYVKLTPLLEPVSIATVGRSQASDIRKIIIWFMIALCAFIGYWQDSSFCISERISDRLHCSIHFDLLTCFFLPINKNLLEYAQANRRGWYTQPKEDKLVATAHFEQEVGESSPEPLTP